MDFKCFCIWLFRTTKENPNKTWDFSNQDFDLGKLTRLCPTVPKSDIVLATNIVKHDIRAWMTVEMLIN